MRSNARDILLTSSHPPRTHNTRGYSPAGIRALLEVDLDFNLGMAGLDDPPATLKSRS